MDDSELSLRLLSNISNREFVSKVGQSYEIIHCLKEATEFVMCTRLFIDKKIQG